MTQVKLWNPYHSSLLLQKANEMRLSQMFCDVHIKVGHQEFLAHSLVLACGSRKFQALFQDHNSRTQDHTKHYSLDFLTGKTFQQILEYSYTESLEARVEDLSSILAAAEVLEMEFLASECLKSLGSLSSQSQKIKDKVLDNPTVDTILKKEADSNRTISNLTDKGIELNRSPYQESHSNSVNGLVQDQKWHHSVNDLVQGQKGHPTTPVRTESENLPKVSLIELSGSLLANGHEEVNKITVNLMDRNIYPASPSKRKVDSEDPSTADNTLFKVEEAENSHNFGNSSFKTRGSVITTATTTTVLQKSQIPENRTRPWSPKRTWGSDGMVTLRSNQCFQPAVPLVSYQLRGFLPSFPMMRPPHTTLSSSVRFHGCVSPFPKGLLHNEHGSSQDLTESSMREVVDDNGGTTVEVQLMEQQNVQDITSGFPCHFCGRCFLNTLHLRLHLHSHASGQPWSCPQCGGLFSSEEELKIHSRGHTKESFAASSSPDHCTVYGKHLSSHNAMQENITAHTGRWGYRCAECDTAFPSQTVLRKHLRTHTGNHHYECEFCGRYFRDEILLKNHKRVHAGEKPYECNGCGKKFSLKHQLETHLRVHTGEKPFKCNLCHQRSRDYSAMIKHLRTHNGAAPYRCTVCLEFCSSLSAMQKHMKSHRVEEIPTNWSIEKTYLYTYSS